MKRWTMLMLLLITQLTGCMVVSQHPLAGITLAPDEPLLGSWYGFDGDDPVFVHVGFEGEALRIVLVEPGGERVNVDQYVARPGRAGDETYLSVQERTAAGQVAEGHHLVRYRIVGGSLEFSFLDEKRMRNEVEQGNIPGVVESGLYGGVRLTAPPEVLATLLTRTGPDLFRPAGRLQRLATPAMKP